MRENIIMASSKLNAMAHIGITTLVTQFLENCTNNQVLLNFCPKVAPEELCCGPKIVAAHHLQTPGAKLKFDSVTSLHIYKGLTSVY